MEPDEEEEQLEPHQKRRHLDDNNNNADSAMARNSFSPPHDDNRLVNISSFFFISISNYRYSSMGFSKNHLFRYLVLRFLVLGFLVLWVNWIANSCIYQIWVLVKMLLSPDFVHGLTIKGLWAFKNSSETIQYSYDF